MELSEAMERGEGAELRERAPAQIEALDPRDQRERRERLRREDDEVSLSVRERPDGARELWRERADLTAEALLMAGGVSRRGERDRAAEEREAEPPR